MKFKKNIAIIEDECIEPFKILIVDEYNYMVVLPLKKPLKNQKYEYKKYFSKLERALLFIIDQKSRLQASEKGRIKLKEYLDILLQFQKMFFPKL